MAKKLNMSLTPFSLMSIGDKVIGTACTTAVIYTQQNNRRKELEVKNKRG